MIDPEMFPEIGAIAEWQAELAAGKRSRLDFDTLWRSAVAEANARDEMRWGQTGAASASRRLAAELILGSMSFEEAA